jgi:hypothetical protein
MYLSIIESLHAQLVARSLNPKFVIFSNEEVSFRTTDITIVYSNMDAMSDLAAMAQCQYIVGPPSTFSMWASFYGKVPHKWVIDPTEYIDVIKLSPIIATSTYQSGETISI